jgi:hypothetical protein
MRRSNRLAPRVGIGEGQENFKSSEFQNRTTTATFDRRCGGHGVSGAGSIGAAMPTDIAGSTRGGAGPLMVQVKF